MSVQGNVVGNDGFFGWLTQTFAVSVLWSSLTGWLPYAVAAIPIVYYLLMIWEMRTVVHFRNNWHQKHIARKYIKLKQREKITLAKLAAIEKLRAARVEARETVKRAEHEAAALVVHETTETKANIPPV